MKKRKLKIDEKSIKKRKLTIEEKSIKKNKFVQKRKFIKKYIIKDKEPFSLFILFGLFSCILDVVQVLSIAKALEYLTLAEYNIAINQLIITLAIVVVRRVCYYVNGSSFNRFSMNFYYNLKNDLTRRLFDFSSKTYNSKNTGAISSRILSYPNDIINNINIFMDNILAILYHFTIIVYISCLNFYLGIILVIGVSLALIVEVASLKVFEKDLKDVMGSNEKIQSMTTEIIKSEKDIKSLALETKMFEEVHKKNHSHRLLAKKMNRHSVNKYTLRNSIIELTTYIILILGVIMLKYELITLAVYLIIYSNNGDLYYFVYCLGNAGKSSKDINVCVTKILDFYDEDVYETEKFGDLSIEKLKGNIEFKKVDYTYHEYEEKENKLLGITEKTILSENNVLKDLSFKIKENTTVAFAGKSGSGKSTILNLISKMLDADNGVITIDGKDIKSLSKETIRKNLGLVNQFPYIFDMTIKENLLLVNKDATDEQIKDCIEKSALTEFISELPNGLDTKVGEGGVKLSGGQKQRLAIARALIKNNKIIIFDESTSSLDNIAQSKVKNSIDKLKGQCTIIMVAHRLSTIRDVDVIYFLDNGKIVDYGSFEILYNKNSDFRNMFMAENLQNKIAKQNKNSNENKK